MNRIIFGGGFDPIHLGHINMAIMAQKAYPGEVIFVPAKIAVWKSSSISQEHKLAMVQIAIKNIPGFSVDDPVAIAAEDVDGICIERSWNMELKPGGRMTHTLERVVLNLD